ncbi:hypothetical protein HanRHA438_Chr08g0370441 [Helianthus annuus]|nr:hypothetical protein HanRHA438_Chr08g0370441 [Helianthus annuus]
MIHAVCSKMELVLTIVSPSRTPKTDPRSQVRAILVKPLLSHDLGPPNTRWKPAPPHLDPHQEINV